VNVRGTPATLADDRHVGGRKQRELAAVNVASNEVDRDVPVPEHDAWEYLHLDVDEGRFLVFGEVPDLRLGKPDVSDFSKGQLRRIGQPSPQPNPQRCLS